MIMETLPKWIEERNSDTSTRPLANDDFAARLIANAHEHKYPKTPELGKYYVRLKLSLKALQEVEFTRCSEDEIKANKKAVYSSYNELINEIQNYLNSYTDEEAQFFYRSLVLKFGHYRHYA